MVTKLEHLCQPSIGNGNTPPRQDTPLLTAGEIFDSYFEYRERASSVKKVEGQELEDIQLNVKNWLEQSDLLHLPDKEEERYLYYTTYSREKVDRKFAGLLYYLRTSYPDKVSEDELRATELFIASSFSMYFENVDNEGKEVAENADGSFAFVVPSRMGRKHPEYGEESETVIPAIRYIPNEMRSQMLVGLPPFVIDEYEKDGNGKKGYLIFAPVTEDFAQDLSPSDAFRAVEENVNATIDFAHRQFGIRMIGLGAILPAYTKYGQTIRNKAVITTTGHGGTIELINKTVSFLSKNYLTPETIGVLGLGSIGASIAHIIADYFPDITLNIYDSNPAKMNRTVEEYRDSSRFQLCSSDSKLIQESDIVVSAIAGTMVDLEQRGVKAFDKPKIIIDDSQPGSVVPAQIEERGGKVIWVVGNDTQGNVATRRGYDYGTLLNPRTDIFGCEAEVACISKYWEELRSRGMPEQAIHRIIAKVAIKGPVKPRNVRVIRALFKKYGIEVADPQVFGKPVQLEQNE